MRLLKWIGVLLIACTACSPPPVEEAESVYLNYWEREEAGEPHEEEYLYEPSKLNLFIEAVNNAEELDEPKIIATMPLLSFSILMEEEEDRNFHLWITEDGEAFLQSLIPAENTTLRIEKQAVKPLQEYLASKENVELIQSDIEFEK